MPSLDLVTLKMSLLDGVELTHARAISPYSGWLVLSHDLYTQLGYRLATCVPAEESLLLTDKTSDIWRNLIFCCKIMRHLAPRRRKRVSSLNVFCLGAGSPAFGEGNVMDRPFLSFVAVMLQRAARTKASGGGTAMEGEAGLFYV